MFDQILWLSQVDQKPSQQQNRACVIEPVTSVNRTARAEACWGSLGARVDTPHSYLTQGIWELGSRFLEGCPRGFSPWCSWPAVPMGGATKALGKRGCRYQQFRSWDGQQRNGKSQEVVGGALMLSALSSCAGLHLVFSGLGHSLLMRWFKHAVLSMVTLHAQPWKGSCGSLTWRDGQMGTAGGAPFSKVFWLIFSNAHLLS